MKTSVLDDLKSIQSRHGELFPNSATNPKPITTVKPAVDRKQWKFKDPLNQLTSISLKQKEIILIYKGVSYGYNGSGWYEIEEG